MQLMEFYNGPHFPNIRDNALTFGVHMHDVGLHSFNLIIYLLRCMIENLLRKMFYIKTYIY
jgi:hypothetical protein